MTESDRPTVYIVEDDPTARESLAETLRRAGHRCRLFSSAEEFLSAGQPDRPGCLLLDYQLPGISGLELQAKLAESDSSGDAQLPIIVVTGHADVPSAVRFMEGGAMTLLEKPYPAEQLTAAVERAIEIDRVRHQVRKRFEVIAEAVDLLSQRERNVLQAIADGQLNKSIARAMEVSVRTIEGDRARIVEKFRAETTGEVVGKYAQFNLLTELGYRLDGAPDRFRPTAPIHRRQKIETR